MVLARIVQKQNYHSHFFFRCLSAASTFGFTESDLHRKLFASISENSDGSKHRITEKVIESLQVFAR